MALTFYKDHLTWQQTLDHEYRDNINFKDKVNFYDFQKKEEYLHKMDYTKSKRFYGAHPLRYMGNTRPVLEQESGVMGIFAPLHKTGFATMNGWAKEYKDK